MNGRRDDLLPLLFQNLSSKQSIGKKGLKGSVKCIQARGLITHIAGHSCDENNVAAA